MAGVQTVTRTVTNVGRSRATYKATFTGMTGFEVKVSPAQFEIRPGRSKTFTVTFTRTSAAFNAYTGGQLTLSDGNHNVRLPMVVRPVALAAPTEVFSVGGPISYDVKFGYTGTFNAAARGLVPATTTDGTVADDPDDDFTLPVTGPDIVAIPVTIPAGITHARFSVFEADVAPGADIDMFVYRGATPIAASADGDSNETVNLRNPPAGDYTVYIHGFGVDPTAGSPFRLYTWLLGQAVESNTTITAPAAATTGATGTITLTFSGLTPGMKYLGTVSYTGSSGDAPILLPNPTIVLVDP